jgi:predicted NACHT family NTPase
VDAFLRLKYHDQPAVYHFLRQALLSRRVLLLLDGLDEGGAKQDEIQRHVTEVLAPQGHVMLCTSRPAGVAEKSFTGFRRFHLSPLTEQQQQEALEQRLGATAVAPLLEYLKRMPVGDDGQLVTSNPLMLSMIASVYELRQGVGMPETIAELYEHASEAMLSRGGASSQELRRVMQAVFFEAHVAQRREIEDWQLDEAALSLELPKVLADIRERFKGQVEKGRAMRDACAQLSPLGRGALVQMRQRVANDKLPLLSLLDTEPLKLQSSHLSFQEYFAARALCEEGTRLSGEPPWQFSAWWQNAIKLGSEMGGFGSGMLRAAGVQGDTLDLSRLSRELFHDLKHLK